MESDIRQHLQLCDHPVPRLALRVGEAADAVSISRSKMYGLIKAGKVRAVLVGDVMRVRMCDLEAYLNGK